MEEWIKAGEIAAKAREYGITLIKPEVSLFEVTEKIEGKIKELGGKCAFPVQLSINSVAAHYNAFVDDRVMFKEGDLVKLDLGVHIDGAVADTAITVDLGDHAKLVEASREALKAALEIVKPGVELREIGKVIEKVITSYGFNPIRNLGGHGLGLYDVHDSPFIPNFDNGDTTKLEKGQKIAIEPFATDGVGMVDEGNLSEIYNLENLKPVRDMTSRKLLKYIGDEFQTLPFAKRWLKDFRGTNFALSNLVRSGVVHHFNQLVEKSGGLVSQHEHTIIVGEKVTTL